LNDRSQGHESCGDIVTHEDRRSRTGKKKCAFMMKRCRYLPKEEVESRFECEDFPCENLKKLDKRYRTRFRMNIIENLEFMKEHGMDGFLRQQAEKYRCLKCGGVICVHGGKCYKCLGSENG